MVFVTVPGGPDAVASDPSDCDVELRVVRRVARVIDELQPQVGIQITPTGYCRDEMVPSFHFRSQPCDIHVATSNSGQYDKLAHHVLIMCSYISVLDN
jgi:hypothetical protein